MAVAVQGRQAFVAGWRNFRARTTPGEKESFVVQSHDPATGQRLWEDDYHVDEFGFFLWHALDIEAVGGRVFASGQETVNGMWLVRAYDASGGAVCCGRTGFSLRGGVTKLQRDPGPGR